MELRCQKDSVGRYLTHAMFFESKTAGFEPTFTFKEFDHEYEGVIYTSMRRLYMEMADPTEYLFAIEVLGSWQHWQKLCNSALIREQIDKWREELEVKLRAESIQAIHEVATTAGSKGTTAAKWIAAAGWRTGKGRPTKKEKARQMKIDARLDEDTESHMQLLADHKKK